MSTQRQQCQQCGTSNVAGSLHCRACGSELVSLRMGYPRGEQGQGRIHRAMWLVLLIGGLLAAAFATPAVLADARRHTAQLYGVEDPSKAVLSVPNRTGGFAMARITFEDPDTDLALQQLTREVVPGQSATLAIAPGKYRVSVSFVELAQAAPDRPQGSLSVTVDIAAGRAAIVRLEGGRSSPEGMLYVPPELVVK